MARLHAILLAAATTVALTPWAVACAQTFPGKAVRLVVGFQPGGGADITARMVGPKLSELWGQPVIVENRPGGGGTLAAGLVAKAIPDGHTLLLASTAFATSAALQPSLPYSPLKDF